MTHVEIYGEDGMVSVIQVLTHDVGFTRSLQIFQITTTLVALAFLLYRPLRFETRGRVWVFGVLWVILSTSEYWVLGSYSFASPAVDVDYSLPFHLYLNEWHGGSRYSHAFAGGNDIDASSMMAGQYVSIERLLLAAFPVWGAQMIYKILLSGVGFAGTYLVCRRLADCGRDVAVGLAAVFTLSHTTLTHYSWAAGFGYALIPLAVYLCVVRVGKSRYVTGVVLLSALHAIGSSPTHSSLAVFPAVVLAAFFVGWRRAIKVVPALTIMALFLIANWHESLYAKILVGPYSYRGIEFAAISNLGVMEVAHQFPESAILMIAALGLLAFRQRKRFLLITAIATTSVGLGPMLLLVPWQTIGFDLFRAVNFSYISYAFTFIASVSFAIAARPWRPGTEGSTSISGRDPARGRLVSLALVVPLALAVGLFATYKVWNLSFWLSEGGLSVLTEGLRSLRNRPWHGVEPVRVVSVPYRLPANLAAAAGLDTFDGALNLGLRSVAIFWEKGVLRHSRPMAGGYVDLKTAGFDMKCCVRYDITEQARLDYLRIANVGFVLSVLPLEGEGIVQVAGPPEGPIPPRNTEPLGRRLRGYVRANFDPPSLRVYALASPLPRVFAASAIVTAPEGATDEEFLALVGRHALARRAVVRPRDLKPGLRADPGLAVRAFTLVRDGFEVLSEAPNGGVVLVNAPYTPFWRASADGRPTDVVAANAVHMAVVVPPGAARIELRYERPMLRDALARLF